MVLPRFVKQALAGEPITIYGDGEQSRCFADVADIIDATIKLAGHPEAIGEVFNIGSTEEVTIRELAEIVARVVGFQGELAFDPSKPDGTPRKLQDVSRIHSLGWKHQVGLEQGIATTYLWYLESLNNN